MNAVNKLNVPPGLEGIRVVDADTHISEWSDLWISRAPAKWKDRVPQKKVIDGKRTWVIDGDKSLGTGNSHAAIRKDGYKAPGLEFMDWQVEDVHPGAYDVKARLKYMDETGVQAQIGYPNVLGFGGQRAQMVDADLRLVSAQIYNEAMAELQAQSGERIFPMIFLPWWDLKAAVEETKRGVKMGLRGVNMNSDPQTSGLPPLSDPYWNPLWEVCLEHDLPVNFHIGASDESIAWGANGFWGEMFTNGFLAYGGVMVFLANCRILANMFITGFFERFPTLKIVSVESGVGWMPFALECIQYEMNETKIPYKVPMKEVFKRQVYGCTWFERDTVVEDTRRLGVDNIMLETDFPHPTCLYPDPLNYLAEATSKFTYEERTKVLGGNCARVYNLPPAPAIM